MQLDTFKKFVKLIFIYKLSEYYRCEIKISSREAAPLRTSSLPQFIYTIKFSCRLQLEQDNN